MIMHKGTRDQPNDYAQRVSSGRPAMANARVSGRGSLSAGVLVGLSRLKPSPIEAKRFPAQSAGSPVTLMRQRQFLRDRREGIIQTAALEHSKKVILPILCTAGTRISRREKDWLPGAGYDYRDFVDEHGQRFPCRRLAQWPARMESKELKEFARPENRDNSDGARCIGPCSKYDDGSNRNYRFYKIERITSNWT